MPPGGFRPKRSSASTSLRFAMLHFVQNFLGRFRLEALEQVGGLVRIHLLDDVGGSFGIEFFDDLRLQALIELGNRFGGGFLVERTDDGLALGGRELFHDVREIGGMQLRQLFAGEAEFHAAQRVGLDQVDEFPRNRPRGGSFSECAGWPWEERFPAAGGARLRARPTSTCVMRSSVLPLVRWSARSTSFTRTTLRPLVSMICWSSRSFCTASQASLGW